nr:MAG TPA: hypothetical protein [Caudoviricetes sp.]
MGGGEKALILVFNKTVKNRFIRLLFQQPAAEPQKNVSPYISRRYRRPAKDSQDKMVLTILSRNSIRTQFAAETEVMWGLTPSYQ